MKPWSFSVLLLAAASVHAGAIYTITDLGSLGGGSSVACAVNRSGSAAGWAATPSGDVHAAREGAGLFTDLTPGASTAYGNGINAAGTVAGVQYLNGEAHGTVWSASGTQDLGAGTYAMAINDAGQLAGGNGHAFISSSSGLLDLGALPGGAWSSAYGINQSGGVTGYGQLSSGAFRAFIWTPSAGMVALGTLGGSNSYGMAIDNAGDVAGHSDNSNGFLHAFVEVNGVMHDLGTLGGSSSYAYGLNNNGDVVGYSFLSGGESHGFVYRFGALLDLNSLVGSNAAWVLTEAYGINDAGQIVGTGLFQGVSHAFRLDPVSAPVERGFFVTSAPIAIPEPATFGIVGAAVLLCTLRVARRRLRPSGKPQWLREGSIPR